MNNRHLRVFTIAEYTHYVLDDPRVKQIIDSFVRYQRVADKMIDAFDMLIDEGQLRFDSTEELNIAREFNRATETTKRDALTRMIDKIHDFATPIYLRDVMRRTESEPHPNVSDMPLIMFKAFAKHPRFSEYLFTGRIDLISGAYFTKDIDLARQKYLVFALFIWTFFDAKSLYDRRSETYYDEAPIDVHASSNATSALQLKVQRMSTSSERLRFLALFRDFIHFDMWESGDYAKRAKEGTVMRLRFSSTMPGQVVIQTCATTLSNCNTVYLITGESMAYLTERYHTADTPLVRLGYFFTCRACESPKAAYFAASSETREFYCDEKCFYSVK